MIASSDHHRKIPKRYLSRMATIAMTVAAPSVAAASTFSTRVSTRSNRCTEPAKALLGGLLGEQVVDQVLADDVGVLLPDRRHHAVLERLALLRGQLGDRRGARLLDRGTGVGVQLRRDLAVVGARLVGRLLDHGLQVGRDRKSVV